MRNFISNHGEFLWQNCGKKEAILLGEAALNKASARKSFLALPNPNTNNSVKLLMKV